MKALSQSINWTNMTTSVYDAIHNNRSFVLRELYRRLPPLAVYVPNFEAATDDLLKAMSFAAADSIVGFVGIGRTGLDDLLIHPAYVDGLPPETSLDTSAYAKSDNTFAVATKLVDFRGKIILGIELEINYQEIGQIAY